MLYILIQISWYYSLPCFSHTNISLKCILNVHKYVFLILYSILSYGYVIFILSPFKHSLVSNIWYFLQCNNRPSQFGSVGRVLACGLKSPSSIMVKGMYPGYRVNPHPWSGCVWRPPVSVSLCLFSSLPLSQKTNGKISSGKIS